ncbi:NLR family CARD domain-containing protein 3 [Labeo rohita]|uniref:NLR family CARD domain-containing protein 3 n=1 Tax=Labeo rohita TaxID=84645 RepID=A0ABQ8M408_LABRO|nr:NLR family CARD domain-containing protein 3 [Labeo rohita]
MLKNAASKMSLYEEREDGDVVHCQNQRAASPEPSRVSLKSNASMGVPTAFSDKTLPFNHRDDWLNCRETGDLRQESYHSVDDELQRVKDHHKNNMKNKYERLFEGIKVQENQTLLNRIYTQLYIVNGESKRVNEEHEILQMETNPRTKFSPNTPLYCNDIFKPLSEPRCEEKENKIKAVLTKGIAGIGKTVSVQKFILDWAEGKANQDVDFMFVLPFRELNLIRDHQYSLHRLLLDFHPEIQDLDSKIYEECKVVFIFDGLDESRITLMFSDSEKVSDLTETSSVGVLMSNLMKGELLPTAFIWITSRPAAASQIPSRYINRVTEIQGFDEPQKEEYFRKRISDEHQASRIISHIKRVRSLHIMCHIPIFCWISATVLQKLLKEDDSTEIPQSLTEMYIHFLLIQIRMRNQKYEDRDPEKIQQSDKDVIVKLSELAFEQLMKGNVMFYEEDLRESDIANASVYYGICTEIFKEESVINQRKVYCFTHLSFQEFLAALYVFYSYLMNNMEPLQLFQDREYEYYQYMWERSRGNPLYVLLRSAVNKTLESEKGHLDLFLRFLLGVSLESNQTLLQNLLTHTENSSETINKIIKYIKDTIKSDNDTSYDYNSDYCDDRSSNQFKEHYKCLSADRSISLFLCLLEVKDQALSREIQEFVNSDEHSEKKLSPAHCSTIAYMIQMSDEVLDEFDPMKYNTSDEGRWRLIPAVINCKKVLLAGCGLSLQHCESLSSALQSLNSCLTELDLSNNDLRDAGVKLLCDGLKSLHCQLNILRLVLCNLTGQCCESLSSALQSSNCSLKELDLSNNDLLDSGVKHLFAGLKRLSGCQVTEEGCSYALSVLRSNPSHLKVLDLSYNHPGESGVSHREYTSNHPNYTLEKLKYV